MEDNTNDKMNMEDQMMKTNAAGAGQQKQKSRSNDDEVVIDVPEKVVPSIPTDVQNQNNFVPVRSHQQCRETHKCYAIVFVLICLAVIAMIIIIVTTRQKHVEEDVAEKVDFSTGVSLITNYDVEATIRSRLAKTKISMTIANALDCVSIHYLSLQLPLNTRITSLKTNSDDGCTTTGEVQKLEDAREVFLDTASSGLPGAYVEATNSFTHSLQVSIPRLGITNVELVVEQILHTRLGKVAFELPFMPNEGVDRFVFDLAVESTDFSIDLDVPGVYDPEALEVNTDTDANMTDTANTTRSLEVDSTPTKSIHLDVPDARQHDLPKVLRGSFEPGIIPDEGTLFADDKCFEHFFRPSNLEPMPRNLFFLIDVSGSMDYNSKLSDARDALSNFIDTLNPQDNFTIQTFAKKGTVNLWGAGPGTEERKASAKAFINSHLYHRYKGATNLHEAFLEGLLRAKADAEESKDSAITILVMLSDGYATTGEQNRAKIVTNIFQLNKERTVKIFTLGFQDNADMELLDAIALLNGGISAPIVGNDNFAAQITTFLESEIGNVLSSDVDVSYTSSESNVAAKVWGETQRTFPLLSDGYEVVVRGLLDVPTHVEGLHLNALVKGSTNRGVEEWTTGALVRNNVEKSSLCFQSYAHARITQLLRLSDAANLLDDDIVEDLVTLKNKCEMDDFVDCIKAEALEVAIEAGVVTKGLTAMVTVDNEKCMKPDTETEVCLDGTTPDPDSDEKYEPDYDYEDSASAHEEVYASWDYPPAGSTALDSGMCFFIISLFTAVFLLLAVNT